MHRSRVKKLSFIHGVEQAFIYAGIYACGDIGGERPFKAVKRCEQTPFPRAAGPRAAEGGARLMKTQHKEP
jgi:hypothetical protein